MNTQPNRIVERHLDSLARQLEKVRGTDLLAYSGPIVYGADDLLKDAIESRGPRNKALTFLLETTGGYIEVAQRIADLLRHHYKTVDFLVPNCAMSAGTVLVMSADSIWMNYYSILGPIDPQVERHGPDGTTQMVPALGYLEKYAELIDKSNTEGLTTAEVTYLVQRFDPAELHSFEQARELSKALLREWLTRYKFKDWNVTQTRRIPVTLKMKANRAVEIAEKLTDTTMWHTHGRGISMAVLRTDLNLRIDDFSDPVASPLDKAVRRYDRALADYVEVFSVGPESAVVHRPGLCRLVPL